MMTLSLLVGLSLKSVLVAGVALAALRALRSRSAAVRSLVAHLGLVALVALPAAVLLPAWQVVPLPDMALPASPVAPSIAEPAAVRPGALDVPSVVETPAAAGTRLTGATLAVGAYLLPVALLLATLLVAVVRLFAMRRRATVLVEARWLAALAQAQRRMGFKHGTALLVSNELRSPISWGVLRPTIVLHPAAVRAPEEAEAIIAHELAHVERWDWAKLLLARLACALFWFNPLVWVLARESHQLREESADDAVVTAHIDRVDYAALLVGAARHNNAPLLLAAHGVAPGRGSLKRRITRVLDEHLDRRRVGLGGSLAGVLLLATLAMPLALLAPATDSQARSEAAAPSAAAVAETRTAPVARRAAAIAPSAPPAARLPRDRTPEPREGAPVDRRASVKSLIAARAVGVDAAYAADLATAYRGVDLDDVVAARASGVDASYAAAMRKTFPRARIGDVIGAHAAGVSAGYAAEMHQRFPDADLDDMATLRATGVTGAFVDDVRRSGVALNRPDDAVSLRAVSDHSARGGHGYVPDPPPPPEAPEHH